MSKAVKYIFLFLVLFPTVFFANCQNSGLHISGFLRDGRKSISGSLVQLYSQGALLTVNETTISGAFEFNLELNREYLIVFASFGYISKSMLIDTSVRDKELSQWDYGFNVELFPEIEEMDFTIFQLPVAKITYQLNWGEFDFDNSYTGKMKDLSSATINLVKKERGAQYQKHILHAEKAIKEHKLIKAIDYYLLANVCEPYSTYSMEQINLTDKNLLKNAPGYARYLELQFLGDSCLREHSFGKATVFFKESVRMFPESKYSWYKRDLADTLHQRFDNTLYKSVKFGQNIALADNYIRSRDYINARIYYEMAAELFPTDEYVFKQIKFLKSMMSESRYDESSIEHRKIVDKADHFYESGDYKSALKTYKDALESNPNDQYVLIQKDNLETRMSSIIEFVLTPRPRSQEFLNKMLFDFDKGKTVEVYSIDNKKIICVTLNDGVSLQEFIKIESEYGDSYYRNGNAIKPSVFGMETGW